MERTPLGHHRVRNSDSAVRLIRILVTLVKSEMNSLWMSIEQLQCIPDITAQCEKIA